jgi:hypothetical protein
MRLNRDGIDGPVTLQLHCGTCANIKPTQSCGVRSVAEAAFRSGAVGEPALSAAPTADPASPMGTSASCYSGVALRN